MALKILIAEDSATNRLLFSTVMTRLGHAADVVATGLEAADLFVKTAYDLVFLDLNMPGLNGIETAVRIQKSNPQHIPLYAISGYPSPEMIAQFDRAGFRDCLIKPLDRDKLATVIRDCGLTTKAAHGAASSPPPAAKDFDAAAVPRRVLETCQRELRSRGQACLGFLTADDRAALLREAHTIRALAEMLNMPALAQMAGQVECRSENEAVEKASLPALDKEVKSLAAASEEAARSIGRYLDQIP